MVFPARAGMSPGISLGERTATSFPRTRGDEPLGYNQADRWDMFSPHARG